MRRTTTSSASLAAPPPIASSDAPRIRVDPVLAVTAAIAVLVSVGVAGDAFGDVRAGATRLHVVLEVLVAAAAALAAALLLKKMTHEQRALALALGHATQAATSSREDAARWREEAQTAVAGLSAAIDRQFDRWCLSPAERDVGLMLLKGLSHKEAAVVLGKSERTVRQQSLSIYKKAGLSGRAELAAFFLEDLLAPQSTASKGGG